MARRRSQDQLVSSLLEIDGARADYAMAKRSGAQTRRIRGVPSQGAGADYHYRTEADWLWMGELAWDIYRNNMIAGSIVDRAIENCLQDGFAYNPNTGDRGLDRDLVEWWTEISQQPSECDPANELDFADQTEIVARATIVAGDIFGLPIGSDDPLDNGTVELKEFHLCRSPTYNTREKKNIVHGVEKDAVTRRRINYHFLAEPIDPFKSATIKKADLTATPAYDEDGERNIFHVRFPKRSHQTRGLTSFAPIFDVQGYHDDVQFLTMVRQRSSGLFLFVKKRASTFDPAYLAAEQKLGVDQTASKAEQYEANQRQYREVAAASQLAGLPGEEITPWSANIPSPEFFPHMKMLLTFMGVNLGMPLVMVLMDGSETNFSGYRGAIDQARMGFRKNQRRLATRWHRPYLRFKILKRAEKDKFIARYVKATLERRKVAGKLIDVFRHTWNPPSWPYINPAEDATADLIRESNMQTSPRRARRERGLEWNDVARETIEDRAYAIRRAIRRAARLNAQGGFKPESPDFVRWRDLAPLPNPERVQLSVSTQQPQPAAKKTNEVNDAG